MYYLEMKAILKPNLKSKTFFVSKSYTRLRGKEKGLVDFKFYQKLLVVLITLSTFLILPESTRELANICETYNSRKLCIVW